MTAVYKESAAPQRLRLSRAKGYRLPPNSIKVSRPGVWGNPFNDTQSYVMFPWTADGAPGIPLRTKPSRERCLDLYVAWLRAHLIHDPHLLDRLRGKNLACWCPLPTEGELDLCHAAILLRLANNVCDYYPPAALPSDVRDLEIERLTQYLKDADKHCHCADLCVNFRAALDGEWLNQQMPGWDAKRPAIRPRGAQ
jgi:hypothetical protein